MLTREQVLSAVRAGKESKALDGRDFSRLLDFFPMEDWKVFGFKPKDPEASHTPAEWTEAVILERLKADLAFAFDKALNKRGISAGLMRAVVQTWLWILEEPYPEGDADDADYPMYGLPLLKRVALRYGFPNPIGDDDGDEAKYNNEQED